MQMGFFVQTILADRYIHQRNMNCIIKKLVQRKIRNQKFRNFVFFEELSRLKFCMKTRDI